jgi:hypothetical protein
MAKITKYSYFPYFSYTAGDALMYFKLLVKTTKPRLNHGIIKKIRKKKSLIYTHTHTHIYIYI